MKAGVVSVLLVVLLCLLVQPGCEGQTKKKTTTTTTTKTTKTTKTKAKIEPYQRKAAKKTNEIRVKHAAPRLMIDRSLAQNATKCAEYYADLGKVDDSCPHKGTSGENVWGQQGTWTQDEVSQVATDSWYEEGKNYDFTKNVPQANTADFTQMIWKKSNKMGFGVAQKNNFTAVTALFAPPGNIEGQFADNVKPNKRAKKPTPAPAAPPPAETAAPPPAETAAPPPAETAAPPATPPVSSPAAPSSPAADNNPAGHNNGKGGHGHHHGDNKGLFGR